MTKKSGKCHKKHEIYVPHTEGHSFTKINGFFDMYLRDDYKSLQLVLTKKQFKRDFKFMKMVDQNTGSIPIVNYYGGLGGTYYTIFDNVVKFTELAGGEIGLEIVVENKIVDPASAGINTNYEKKNPLYNFLTNRFIPLNNTSLKNNGYIVIEILPFLDQVLVEYFYVNYITFLFGEGNNFAQNPDDINTRESLEDFRERTIINLTTVKGFPKNARLSFNVSIKNFNIHPSWNANKNWMSFLISIQFLVLPKKPMKSRPYDMRVGSFNTGQYIKNYAIESSRYNVMRVKLSQTKKFKVYVDPSNPPSTYAGYQDTINKYNAVFNNCGYDNPLELVTPDSPNWPDDYDLHDIRFSAFIAVDDSEPYWGVAGWIVDDRSGEILSFVASVVSTVTNRQTFQSEIIDEFGMTSLSYGSKTSCHQCCCITPDMMNIPFSEISVNSERFNAYNQNVQTHEIGHCFGLRHNFAASFQDNLTPDTTSIMDYDAGYFLNNTSDGVDFYISSTLGIYDVYALTYMYQILPEGDQTQALQNMAAGYPWNYTSAPLPARNPLFVTDEDITYDYRGAQFDYGTSNRAENYMKVRTIIRESYFKALLDGKISPTDFSNYWQSYENVSRLTNMILPLFGASIPSDDKTTFSFVDPVLQYEAVNSLLFVTNSDNFFQPTPEELPYLRTPILTRDQITFPNSSGSYGLFPYNNKRLDISSVRTQRYFTVFLNVWNSYLFSRVSFTNNYGPTSSFFDELFYRLFMSPGTKYGDLIINPGAILLKDAVYWSTISSGVYLTETGLYPEINDTIVQITNAQITTILTDLTESDRQRREVCLSAFFYAILSDNVNDITSVNFFKSFFNRQKDYYESTTFKTILNNLSFDIQSTIKGHIDTLVSLLRYIIGYMVGGSFSFIGIVDIGINMPVNDTIIKNKIKKDIINGTFKFPENINNIKSTSIVNRKIDIDEYDGLTKEEVIYKIHSILKK